jgi:hypothetical protein
MVYQTFIYPGIGKSGAHVQVCEVNRAALFQFCLDGGNRYDSGEKITGRNMDRLLGCHAPGQIYYLRGYSCVLGHELCHEAGLPLEVCDSAYHTEKFCK